MRKVESVLEPILDAVGVNGKAVVDVGCGTGENARALGEQGARVIGVDRPEVLSKVEDSEGAARVEFLEGAAEELPIDDASADLVLFLASLEACIASKSSNPRRFGCRSGRPDLRRAGSKDNSDSYGPLPKPRRS